ncbi:anti sigma factor C-terminal domain-containing protein [Bacillus sp. FJAT-45037]|uniref:anti sigma factor C-terminal domain-containing protein n=1 Tax=Bacillus sp. FJAT-45037 TaxID=2011007 RepID=UPI000C23921A|nr:anti sigma factor C-terminal domain-containing protein [Bacillus sp. FJAT-45037]
MKESPFKPDELNKVMNKAKRKSLFRNIVISVVTLLVLGTLLVYVNNYIVNRAFDRADHRDQLLLSITQPNVERSGTTRDFNILSGDYSYQQYKQIEDKVVPWGREFRTFNALGQNSHRVPRDEVTMINSEDQRIYHSVSGQRLMRFYHPLTKYEVMHDDLELIEQAPGDAVMEVALSFDQGYTVGEVRDFLGLQGKITWFWANQHTEDTSETMYERTMGGYQESIVYGFNATGLQGEGDRVHQTEGDYLHLLEQVKESGAYSHHIDHLIQAAHDHIGTGLILGVVVTGTKEELQSLEQEEKVRAISLGAVVTEF